MKKAFTIIFTVFICFVFIQSLPFKFTNSPETQYIFSTLGEWSGLTWFGNIGGYLIGIFELIASIMLLIPLVSKLINKPVFQPLLPLGALFSMGIMTGAIFFHLFTPLGVALPHEEIPGILFTMACFTWLSALGLVLMDWCSSESELKKLIKKS